jgi:signal transduction histidine kinase
MHGWGQWYAFAAAAFAIASYTLGRRGLTWAIVVVLAACETASTVAVATTQDVPAWLTDQVVIIGLGVFFAMAGSYRRLRHEFTARGWSQAQVAQNEARLRERARIAAEIHDTLGHDLTLLSLQAAGIQVTAADPATRERAAAMRLGAAQAISTVRRIVDVLGDDRGPDPSPALSVIVQEHRLAGAAVTMNGDLPASATAGTCWLAGRVVAQALANAAQHAPDQPVAVTVGADSTTVTLEFVNDCGDATSDVRPGTGLVAMAERLRLIGGTLDAQASDGRYRLDVRLPLDVPATAPDDPGPAITADHDRRRRRARTALVATVVAPLTALIVLATGFYAWASHDATIEPDAYARLHIGMSERDATAILPSHQAPVRSRIHDDTGCRYYTDGNFPLAWGNLVICFRNGRITLLDDRSGASP